MKFKTLEKTVILSIALSASGTVWAADNDLIGTFKVNNNGDPVQFPTINYDTNYNNINISMIGTTGNRTTLLFGVNGMGQTDEKVFTAKDGESISIVNTAKSNYEYQLYGQKLEGLTNNDAVFALGGSTINLEAKDVYIVAIGNTGLTTDNAISAKNTGNSDTGNNTVNVSGGTVKIIGDIDFSGSTQPSNNTVNLNLSGKDSYWYGNVKGVNDTNIANISLSDGAEWIYRYQGKIDVNQFGQHLENDGNRLENLTLEGGVVNLDDDEINKIYENTIVVQTDDNGQKVEYKLADYFKGLNTDINDSNFSSILSQLIANGITNLEDLTDVVNHQSVEIENLKGSGGIFKVNLNWEDNQYKKYTDKSDYIYISKSEEGSVQTLVFDASKANIDKMDLDDKLYFANVEDGNTQFITASNSYIASDNILKYDYESQSENGNTDWYIGITGKTLDGNPNYESNKAAMYASYTLGTEMDRLNKRIGEAKYIENEKGLWVRYRHAKIGWDNTFETCSDMFQLGYDNLVSKKDGKHYRGVAVDYTDANTSIYSTSGDGKNERYAVSIYDTWLGEKGHYRDLVLRGGRINSEYNLKGYFTDKTANMDSDYHQWFGSISAEWGYKNEINNGWYFEPQTQLQLARVGSASYLTSNGISVAQDGTESLIGRVGFRLGREYTKADGTKHDNYYIKADLLHEFMGDKEISLVGADGRYSKEYDGNETWFDVGLGADISTGKDSYFWFDAEHSFGSDWDNTWQVNCGFRWEWK